MCLLRVVRKVEFCSYYIITLFVHVVKMTEAETSRSASDEGVTPLLYTDESNPPTAHRGTRNGVGFGEIGNGTLRHN